MQYVRIYEIPDCKMVSSGVCTFGSEKFDRFCEWLSTLPRGIFPRDFLSAEDGGMCWFCLYEEGMAVPEEFSVVDFAGGLYAVATDIDLRSDMPALNAEIERFLAEHGFERDPSRAELGNIITPPAAREVMGFEQMDYWMPIKPRS